MARSNLLLCVPLRAHSIVAAGSAFVQSSATAKAAGKAVDIQAFKSLVGSNAKVMVPSLIA